MTQSVRSVDVVVRLYFQGNDVSRHVIEEAINDMEYDFHYDDDYLKIVDAEIVDAFVSKDT